VPNPFAGLIRAHHPNIGPQILLLREPAPDVSRTIAETARLVASIYPESNIAE